MSDRRFVRGPHDFEQLFPGATVTLVCSPAHTFVVTDTRAIFTEDGEVPNPVTIVGVTERGKLQRMVVSAYTLRY